MTDCIFCNIAKKEIESYIIYEDKEIMAFLDIQPASKKGGHTLVIPKKHYETIEEVPEALLNKIMKVVKKISAVLMKIFEGVNIVQNNKKIAGQFVSHLHFHIIPRYKDDGIMVEKWECHKYQEGEAENICEKIRKLLN